MHAHGILKCRYCNIVITQCRCIDKNKEVRLTVCAKCKEMLHPKDAA